MLAWNLLFRVMAFNMKEPGRYPDCADRTMYCKISDKCWPQWESKGQAIRSCRHDSSPLRSLVPKTSGRGIEFQDLATQRQSVRHRYPGSVAVQFSHTASRRR